MGKAKRIIPVGDGRTVEVTEGELFAPPPAPPAPKPKPKNRKKRPVSKKPIYQTKAVEEGGRPELRGPNVNRGFIKHLETIPGYREWLRMRRAQINQFRNKLGFPSWKTRRGIPDGMRREDAEAAWAEARRKAKIDMANIKTIITIEDDRAEEALVSTLEIMRSPMNQTMRLAAARQVLEWTRAKPAAKSEVTVNAAEAWLAQIAEEAAPKAE